MGLPIILYFDGFTVYFACFFILDYIIILIKESGDKNGWLCRIKF